MNEKPGMSQEEVEALCSLSPLVLPELSNNSDTNLDNLYNQDS